MLFFRYFLVLICNVQAEEYLKEPSHNKVMAETIKRITMKRVKSFQTPSAGKVHSMFIKNFLGPMVKIARETEDPQSKELLTKTLRIMKKTNQKLRAMDRKGEINRYKLYKPMAKAFNHKIRPILEKMQPEMEIMELPIPHLKGSYSKPDFKLKIVKALQEQSDFLLKELEKQGFDTEKLGELVTNSTNLDNFEERLQEQVGEISRRRTARHLEIKDTAETIAAWSFIAAVSASIMYIVAISGISGEVLLLVSMGVFGISIAGASVGGDY